MRKGNFFLVCILPFFGRYVLNKQFLNLLLLEFVYWFEKRNNSLCFKTTGNGCKTSVLQVFNNSCKTSVIHYFSNNLYIIIRLSNRKIVITAAIKYCTAQIQFLGGRPLGPTPWLCHWRWL